MEVQVSMVGFLYTEVNNMLLGPGETKESKIVMEQLLLGTSGKVDM